jgi:U3 small nucleolar RNA-associated protein 24
LKFWPLDFVTSFFTGFAFPPHRLPQPPSPERHAPTHQHPMGKTKKTKRFATVKRRISTKDHRLKKNSAQAAAGNAKKHKSKVKHVEQAPSALFFAHNEQLGPPYQVLIDTNFINFSIQNKLDICKAMMDCLLAKCIPCVTDCVIGELEKLGPRYKVALRIAKDHRFRRLTCTHKGTYADDCLCDRVKGARCYIVATCDKDLRRRIRKVPGVPIMFISQHKYTIERMVEAFGAPRSG